MCWIMNLYGKRKVYFEASSKESKFFYRTYNYCSFGDESILDKGYRASERLYNNPNFQISSSSCESDVFDHEQSFERVFHANKIKIH